MGKMRLLKGLLAMLLTACMCMSVCMETRAEEVAEENTFTAFVDGVQMTFYLVYARYSSWDKQYECDFYSFTEEGQPLYSMYMRIDKSAVPGSYDQNSSEIGACYFSIHKAYDSAKDSWGDSYYMVKYGSSRTEPFGMVTLNLTEINSGNDKISGSCELLLKKGLYGDQQEEGESSVTGGVFSFTLNQSHPAAQQWDTNKKAATPDADLGDSGLQSEREEKTKTVRYWPCPKCSGFGSCPVCHGVGWTVGATNSRSRDCPYCVGGTCSRCNGTGRIHY